MEAERGYWKKLETVEVSLAPHKEGWFLQKYIVESDASSMSWLKHTRLTNRKELAERYLDATRILFGS